MINPVLEVKNLTKKFGSFTAVDNISFKIDEGEIVGFLGPNGAGKTTTINMLLNLISPTEGHIYIFGDDLTKKRTQILKQVNFSSSYINLPWRLTVWENLYTFALLYEVASPTEKIEKLLEVFDISQYRNKQVGFLSSGQKTRAILAKAFINNPRLVLLDEPTASLDPDIAAKVRKYLKNMQKEQKITILFTSHNMAEVEEVCDRVIFINHGKIVAEDTPEGLAARIRDSKVQLMITDGMKRTVNYCQKWNYAYEQEGRFIRISIPEDAIAEFLITLAGEGISYKEISIDKPTLEDFFIQKAYE